MTALPAIDLNDYYGHKPGCKGTELISEPTLNRMKEPCLRITCTAGCGYRLLNIARHFTQHPHAGSPYRCRAHHSEAVDSKGRGCRPCAHERATAKRKPDPIEGILL